MKNKYLEIGIIIKQARMTAGLSQLILAKKLNCSASLVNYYEKGTRKPTLIDAFKIELVLGLKDEPVSQLCIGQDYRVAATSMGLRPFDQLFHKGGGRLEKNKNRIETMSKLELGQDAKVISVPVKLPKEIYLKLEFE